MNEISKIASRACLGYFYKNYNTQMEIFVQFVTS
jgi:hypothetical protein